MTQEEYKKRVAELQADHDKALRELKDEYALSNNPYKIGDIIEDHIGKGRITGMHPTRTYMGEPTMLYVVDNLIKKGEINKREPTREIYQSNIRK